MYYVVVSWALKSLFLSRKICFFRPNIENLFFYEKYRLRFYGEVKDDHEYKVTC